MTKKTAVKKTKRKNKIKDSISVSDFPQHLRHLADIFEEGRVPLADGIEIASISSLKLLFKYDDYKNIVRIRIAFEYPPEPKQSKKTDVETKTVFIGKKGKIKQPALKKIGKKMNKILDTMLSAGTPGVLPDHGLAEEFYGYCETMVLHTVDGSTYLEEYLKSARTLADSIKSGDIQQTGDALERLRYIRTAAKDQSVKEKE